MNHSKEFQPSPKHKASAQYYATKRRDGKQTKLLMLSFWEADFRGRVASRSLLESMYYFHWKGSEANRTEIREILGYDINLNRDFNWLKG